MSSLSLSYTDCNLYLNLEYDQLQLKLDEFLFKSTE